MDARYAAQRCKLSHGRLVATEFMKTEANKKKAPTPVGSGDWLGTDSITDIKI